MNPIVHIYTDGSVQSNPGPGGWAAILIYAVRAKVIGGFDKNTTNNRMEAEAVAKALVALKCSCQVVFFTDSQYVIFGLHRLFRGAFQVKNQDIWERIREAVPKHNVRVEKVRGHAYDWLNDAVDYYAAQCSEKQEILNGNGYQDLGVLKALGLKRRVK